MKTSPAFCGAGPVSRRLYSCFGVQPAGNANKKGRRKQKMDITPVLIKVAAYLVLGTILGKSSDYRVWIVCAVIILLMDLWPALQKDLDGFVMGLEFTGAALVTFIMVRCMQSGWVGWLIKK